MQYKLESKIMNGQTATGLNLMILMPSSRPKIPKM